MQTHWRPLVLFLSCSAAACASTQEPFDPNDPPDAGADTSVDPANDMTPIVTPDVPIFDGATIAPTTIDFPSPYTPDTDGESIGTGDDGASTASTPPFDTSDGGVCTQALGAGDLVIDELMIESVAGSG